MQTTATTREQYKATETQAPARPSILTTHHKRFHPRWMERATLLPGWFEAYEKANVSFCLSLVWAIRLFRQSRQFDAVVTGAEHCGMWFAMMQTLFRRPSQRRPHVMIDFPWAARPGRFMLWLKRWQMRIAAPSLEAIFAHASPEEAERLTRALRVRPGLFVFVPFHHSFDESTPKTKQGSYVFSGGNTARDYETLIAAVAGGSYPVVICTQQAKRWLPLPNVTIEAVSQERFYERMAQAAMVALPLMKDDIHPAGHTIVVNAMALGKPIVLAAPGEYRCYIEDGRTGLLVPPGDAVQLRAAIERLLVDPQFAAELGRNAKQDSSRFTQKKFFARVFAMVDDACEKRRVANGGAR